MAQVIIRPAQESDMNFVYSTWLKGQRFGDPYFQDIPKDTYYRYYKTFLFQVLSQSEVRVAVLADDPDMILGFSVISSQEVLHWVFVRSTMRGQGVGRTLLQGPIRSFTGRTKAGAALGAKRGWAFNPWAI